MDELPVKASAARGGGELASFMDANIRWNARAIQTGRGSGWPKRGLLGLGLGAGGNGRFGLGGGHAQHAVAILALDQLPAVLVWNRKDLAALEVGTKQLDGHTGVL